MRGRSGAYRLDRPIARYGIDAELFDWSYEILAICPRKKTLRTTMTFAVLDVLISQWVL
jgi:hypothetical protein